MTFMPNPHNQATPPAGRTVTKYGSDALLVTCGPDEQAADVLLAIDVAIPTVREAHCTEHAILVQFNAANTDVALLTDQLATILPSDFATHVEHLTLPIRYDGDDLTAVADRAHLTVTDVVALHTGATYTVAFDGFSPGFAYLTGLPPELHLPRLDSPRARIPAGSVAIAAHYCAIYPSASAGGWHLIGTSSAELFNAQRNPPALLRPGTTVRFEVAK